MGHILSFSEFVNEKNSGEVLKPKRGDWVKIDPKKHKELDDEFYDLIQTAYAAIGGHAKINKPEDVFKDKDWNYWQGSDIHNSPDLDIIIWGQKTKYGIKFSGVGHDGSKDAKKTYLNSRMKQLHQPGFYGEISGKLADILIGDKGVPTVDNEADVEKVLGKKVEWSGEHPTDPNMPGKGWYTRTIGGKKHPKILVGKPKI